MSRGRFDYRDIRPEAFRSADTYTDSLNIPNGIASDLLWGRREAVPKPWITVIIPTIGRVDLLREALRSVLSQETADFPWEVLVVDNSPPDGEGRLPVLECVSRLGSASVLYYHNREDLGPGYNWNRGAVLARGEWLVWLHDDDLLCRDALRNIGRQIRAWRGSRPLGWLHARRLDFTGSSPKLEPVRRFYPPERLTRLGYVISGCTGAGAPTCGTAVLRQAWLETGGINYAYGPSADAVLCCQIMDRWSVVCSERILGWYRWGYNESLKQEALLGMVLADALLFHQFCRHSRLSRLWESMFGAACSWRNVSCKCRTAVRNGIPMSRKDFASVALYPEPGPGRKALFLGIYAAYRLLRLADGSFRAFRNAGWRVGKERT